MALQNMEQLNAMHFDVLREIGNIGQGNAASSLSQMLSQAIDISVPSVKLLDFNESVEYLGGPENIVLGNDVPATVTMNENLGMNTLVHAYVGGNTGVKVTAKLKGWTDYKADDTVSFTFDRKHFFDKETTVAIHGGEL